MGDFAIDTKRIADWLYFCMKNSAQNGELAFDESGLLNPRELKFSKLNFSREASWTYFEAARDAGFLKNFAGNAPRFYRFALSDKGVTFIQENRVGWLRKQAQRLGENLLTIAVAVLVALATQWALSVLGPTP